MYLCRYILSGAPGACNDPSILHRSSLEDQMEQEARNGPPKYHIIADAAFPLNTWLMKPFLIRNNMPVMEENFNYRLSSARMTIENAFGRLKARWRILLRKPDVHIETMRKLIYACLLLHNFCEFNKQNVLEEWIEKSEREESLLVQDNAEKNLHNPNTELNFPAKQKRMELARRMFYDNLSIR